MKNTRISEIYKAVERIFDVDGCSFDNQTKRYQNYTIYVYSKKIHIKKIYADGTSFGVFIVSDDPNVKGDESNIQLIVEGVRTDGGRLIKRFSMSDSIGDFFKEWKSYSDFSRLGLTDKILAEIEFIVYSFIEEHIR